MSSLPTLFHKSRTGAIHSWVVWTNGYTIYSEHGQIDGQKIISTKEATGKNIGRSNETTPEQQAVIESAAMHKHKLERKYSLSPDEAKEDVLLPMLAHSWEKYEKKVQFPLDVQPKLDGCRALARWEGDKVVLISRSGKPWLATTHINEELERILPKDAVLDGEIYLHGKGFQWITARTKKKQPGTELLEFHVYDAPELDGDETYTWNQRACGIFNIVGSLPVGSPVKCVNTVTKNSKEELMIAHDSWVGLGYEGLIARVHSAPYEYGHRSPSLLKVKSFSDSEYAIVGHTDGLGVEKGLVIWTCFDPVSGKNFDTRPRGTHTERRELFNEAESYYGQKLKVRYMGLTDIGVPRFPIGIGIRAEEDL